MSKGTKRARVLDRLVKALRSYEPEKIYLFGSWARGEEDELSDLDIVLIKETDAPFFSRLQEVMAILPSDTPADVLVYTPREFRQMSERGNAFAEMLLEEGKLIYGR
jgi:predicted nucleotidyltransferase